MNPNKISVDADYMKTIYKKRSFLSRVLVILGNCFFAAFVFVFGIIIAAAGSSENSTLLMLFGFAFALLPLWLGMWMLYLRKKKRMNLSKFGFGDVLQWDEFSFKKALNIQDDKALEVETVYVENPLQKIPIRILVSNEGVFFATKMMLISEKGIYAIPPDGIDDIHLEDLGEYTKIRMIVKPKEFYVDVADHLRGFKILSTSSSGDPMFHFKLEKEQAKKFQERVEEIRK